MHEKRKWGQLISIKVIFLEPMAVTNSIPHHLCFLLNPTSYSVFAHYASANLAIFHFYKCRWLAPCSCHSLSCSLTRAYLHLCPLPSFGSIQPTSQVLVSLTFHTIEVFWVPSVSGKEVDTGISKKTSLNCPQWGGFPCFMFIAHSTSMSGTFNTIKINVEINISVIN